MSRMIAPAIGRSNGFQNHNSDQEMFLCVGGSATTTADTQWQHAEGSRAHSEAEQRLLKSTED